MTKLRTKLESKELGGRKYWIPSYQNKVRGVDNPPVIFSPFSGDGIEFKESEESTVTMKYKWNLFETMEEGISFLREWTKKNPEWEMPTEIEEDFI